MYKYLICIIFGIFLFLLYNNYDSFSVGVPNFLYLKNDRGEWEVKNTLDPLLTDLSGYTERLKDIFVFPHIVEAREYKDGIVTNPINIHILLEGPDQYCKKYPIFVDVQDKLVELNSRLQSKCPSLRLHIEKNDNEFTFLTLCLYYNDECISRVVYTYFYFNIDVIEIDINTSYDYKKRKYMSLLSSILFMTTSMIICSARIDNLYFTCVNPIAVYYLLNNFNYTTDFLLAGDFEKEKKIAFNEITEYTFKNLKIFIDTWGNIKINIELTPENIRRAQVMFDELVGDGDKSIICPEVVIQDTTCGAQSK
tara:strand:- start:846 stop:1772 length:927 start_codon:yes stop_codon:yes gene_type:complete